MFKHDRCFYTISFYVSHMSYLRKQISINNVSGLSALRIMTCNITIYPYFIRHLKTLPYTVFSFESYLSHVRLYVNISLSFFYSLKHIPDFCPRSFLLYILFYHIVYEIESVFFQRRIGKIIEIFGEGYYGIGQAV